MRQISSFLFWLFLVGLLPACSDDREPVKTCQGEPTACALIDIGTCYWQDGCRVFDDCSGVSWACNLFSTVASCNAQHGCTWSTSTDSCSGVPWTCDQMDDSPDWCNGQQGCSSQTACGDFGVRACEDQMTLQECDRIAGCSWE